MCVSACLILSLTVSVISLSFFSSSPRISGDAAQVCDSVKIGTGSHSIYMCLPSLLLSHCLFPIFLALFPDTASGSGSGSVPLWQCVCPSHLSWSLLWPHNSPFSVCSLCFLPPAPQPLSGDITEILEFGTPPVLGRLRAPG